jgi:hypothetical protein
MGGGHGRGQLHQQLIHFAAVLRFHLAHGTCPRAGLGGGFKESKWMKYDEITIILRQNDWTILINIGQMIGQICVKPGSKSRKTWRNNHR